MRTIAKVVLLPFMALGCLYGGLALLVIVEQVITWLR